MTPTVAQSLVTAQARGLARIDVQRLLLHALGRAPHERAWLLAHDLDMLTPAQAVRFGDLCDRRLQGEPVAYLVGQKNFHGVDLAVDARVLDPREDTETLVDWALACIAPAQACRVADLGTGSGAIALSLGARRPLASITATDISADALDVARANGERLGVAVRWRQGSWYQPLAGECFDVIVSNPPYIAEGDPHLPALRHEPSTALVSGADGLDDLRRIVAGAPAHLRPAGWLLLEHGWDQAGAVRELLRNAGFEAVQSRPDGAGIARCSGGRWQLFRD